MKNFILSSKIKISIILLSFGLICLIYTSCNKGSTYSDSSTTNNSKYTSQEIFKGILLVDGPVATKIPALNEILSVSKKIESKETVEAKKDVINKIIINVNKYYPGFLNQFKEEVLSKDPVRIDEAIKRGSDMILKVVLVNSATTDKQLITDAFIKNSKKLDQLLDDIKKGVVNNTNFTERARGIFGEGLSNNLLSQSGAQLKRDLSPDCIAINFALAINIAIAINVAGYINLALAVNAETAANFHFAINITSEVSSRLAFNQPGLKREQYIMSIINNI